jgi:arylformamidase
VLHRPAARSTVGSSKKEQRFFLKKEAKTFYPFGAVRQVRLDYEAEYNNPLKVPGHPAIIAGWARDGAAFRMAHTQKELDLSYGPSPRQAMDVFWPGAARAGRIALFLHGGYWQKLDRFFFSHAARGLLAHGVAVAVASYDLCPQVTLAEIVAEIAVAATFLRDRYGRLDLAFGHSAGGHLSATLLAAGLVPAALPISGVFDLVPLVSTSINEALRLNAAEALRLSPMFVPRPAAGRMHAVVGGEEGVEFTRQSREMAQAWGGTWEALPGHDHFTICDELISPESRTVLAAMRLIEGAR